jgi:uncharacterized protein (DUF849 family)
MVAPTGARRSKADHTALPITTDEIVATAVACHAAGAHALHLHVRDGEGRHSLDAGRYREALDELGARVSAMAVQITTESADIFDVAQQFACLKTVRPAWASISVREIARDPDLAPRVYAACAEQGTRVQHILYDTRDIATLRGWRQAGIVHAGQDEAIFVLGRYAPGQITAPADLDPFLTAWPAARGWMACAFGTREHACLAAAARMGGAVRVGFENSLTDADGRPHSDNAASVSALLTLIESIPA